MSQESTFSGILGYDFLRKFRVNIDQDYTKCIIGDMSIPFLNMESEDKNVCCNTFSENFSDCSLPQTEILSCPSNNSQLVNTPNSILQHKVNKHNFKVLIAKNASIEPGGKQYIKVTTKLQPSCSGNFVFSPKETRNQFKMHTSLYNVPEIQNSSNSNLNEVKFTFHIYIENSSVNLSNLKKNQHIGFFSPVEDIKIPPDSSTQAHENKQLSPESVNVIHPSKETLEERLAEFNIEHFHIDHLPPLQKEKLTKILTENYAAFSLTLKTLGHSDLVKPELKFTSNCPIKCLPFPIPQALQAEAKKQIQDLIEAGIIEKNLTNWACPMILVKKKAPDNKSTQSYRLALDLRLINTIIESSSYPLPRIQDLISNLTEFAFFSSLDMPSAYHQIHLPEEYQDQLSFATPWATYKYLRLVFGLKTAAQYFQSMADSIIEEVAEDGLFAYQDDFLIGSRNFDDTCRKLEKILKIFQKHNLTLNPKKCSFHQTKVKYLGFEIEHHKVYPIASNITKINSFPEPKSKKHVKRFLGLCGYYRHLIPAFAKISAPLVKITSSKVPFQWNTEQQQAFAQLQSIFFKSHF